jgi:hypothetical protein
MYWIYITLKYSNCYYSESILFVSYYVIILVGLKPVKPKYTQLMNKVQPLILLFLTAINFSVISQNLDTWFEKSDYLETPRYDKTIEYCKELEKNASIIKYTSFGISLQGRELPLLIADKNGNFDPVKVRKSGNMVLLIQACIHAGEPDGKDAGFMLLRNLITNKLDPALLDHVTVLFIPIYNVDGHERFGPYNRINQNGPKEMGWRVNAQNMNLNRDYLKADAPETQAWLKLFNNWLPDFFIDCHTTDGADYQYSLTYGAEIYGNLDSSLTKWMKDDFLPEINKRVEKEGYPVFPYIAFKNWGDPRSGLRTWASPPRFSTGYAALQNRAGVLIETHMLKDYKTRVFATYSYLANCLQILNANYKTLKNLNKYADIFSSGEGSADKDFPLKFLSSGDSEMVEFKGVKYQVIKSDLTGGDWIKYSDTPFTYHLPYFNKQKAVETCSIPLAYIIPAEWTDLIRLLDFHSIIYHRLTDTATIKVNTYYLSNPKWQAEPYEGHHPLVSFDKKNIVITQTYPTGTIVVPTSQRNVKLIAHILEPAGPDSYLNWGGFDAIFEQKEYAESYQMERIAREMLQNNPSLRKEFDLKMQSDKAFAQNSWMILNWFYSKSNYWDKSLYIFPIGKVFDNHDFHLLPLK